MARKDLKEAIKIREDFYDAEHTKQARVKWEWPKEMVEVGDCEAVLYTSNKWQANKSEMIDYKHIKEGRQKLLLHPRAVFTGDEDDFFGPLIDLSGDFPDSFAVLADAMGVQARLYSDDEGKRHQKGYVDLKFPRGSKLGAGKFRDGGTFVFIYDANGVIAIVIGAKLKVLKDGIVG